MSHAVPWQDQQHLVAVQRHHQTWQTSSSSSTSSMCEGTCGLGAVCSHAGMNSWSVPRRWTCWTNCCTSVSLSVSLCCVCEGIRESAGSGLFTARMNGWSVPRRLTCWTNCCACLLSLSVSVCCVCEGTRGNAGNGLFTVRMNSWSVLRRWTCWTNCYAMIITTDWQLARPWTTRTSVSNHVSLA